MRPALAVSFILLLFVSLFGFHISFMAQRNAIRNEMRQIIKAEKKKHTRQFVFTEEEYKRLNKYEGGKEFSLHGNMYDVVKKETLPGKVILTAYFDHKETHLLQTFLQLFEEDRASHDNANKTKSTFSLPEFIQEDNAYCLVVNTIVFRLFNTGSHTLTAFYNPLTPPPDKPIA
jgi:hypothetical protein